MRRHTQFALGGVALTALFVGVVQAAPLTPPSGPVTSTGPTQIFALPFTITQPGSYILTSNLTGIAGSSGITVDADDVTIDLNGFALLGVPGSLDGVRPLNNHRNLAVVNGVVADWDGIGVSAAAPGIGHPFSIQTMRLDNLIVSGNGGIGILAAVGSVVTKCIARNNTSDGILMTNASGVAENCVLSNNGGDGIEVADGGVVRGCSALNNTGIGINALNGESTIVNCTAVGNTGGGINGGARSTIRNCTTKLNVGDGIRVTQECYVVGNNCIINGFSFGATAAGVHAMGGDNRIEANNVTGNGVGILVDNAGNFIVKNSASGNGVNYSITGAQTIGPIITATGTIATTNPWANFSY